MRSLEAKPLTSDPQRIPCHEKFIQLRVSNRHFSQKSMSKEETPPDMEEDPFDTVQNLEEQYYNEGHTLGVADGTRVGHLEGRFFGLEKGFEKSLEMGKLRGKSLIWSNRLPSSHSISGRSANTIQDPSPPLQPADRESGSIVSDSMKARGPANAVLLPLSPSLPIEKHLQSLHALSEPESLDTHNSEDAVSEFNDRLKRARAKARIIEKLIGEEVASTRRLPSGTGADDANIEDANILSARH